MGYEINSKDAVKTARYAVLDAVGCALLSLNFPECTKLLGPVVPGALGGPHGASVVGTAHELDPVTAAHNFATAIRWLDYNDAWCASEWVHPSDVVGAILPLSEYLSKVRMARHLPPLTMRDVVTATIKAYEIMGILATENSPERNRRGRDPVHARRRRRRVRADARGGRREVADAASQAFADGAGLRCFRHYPNVGPRKGWAAGDAASRGVWIALLTMRGERGHNLVLTAPVWGFNDVFFRKNDLRVRSAFKTHVAENVVFKVSFPAETHAQTAVEASFLLHPQVVHRVDEIHSVVIHTTRAAVRVIDKTGPLRNPADRDHCLRYAVAIGLLYGVLTAEHYEDAVASDPRVDELRERTQITENPQYSADYLDPDRRSVANAVQIHFRDRTSTSRVEIEYPLGHRRRRAEGFPQLEKKLVARSRRVCRRRAPAACSRWSAILRGSTPWPCLISSSSSPPRRARSCSRPSGRCVTAPPASFSPTARRRATNSTLATKGSAARTTARRASACWAPGRTARRRAWGEGTRRPIRGRRRPPVTSLPTAKARYRG